MTPLFHHIALLEELRTVAYSGELYTYHSNILRSILERTASCHGYDTCSTSIRTGEGEDSLVHKPILNFMSHGDVSLFNPKEIGEEDKGLFRSILGNFIEDYRSKATLFNDASRWEERCGCDYSLPAPMRRLPTAMINTTRTWREETRGIVALLR